MRPCSSHVRPPSLVHSRVAGSAPIQPTVVDTNNTGTMFAVTWTSRRLHVLPLSTLEAANPDLSTDHAGTACGRLLLVLCGAANELAESSLCTLELASPRRIIAKTKAFVEQSKQFGDVVRSVVVFAALVHTSTPECPSEHCDMSVNRP
jgi:hypothetical protein